MWYRQDVRLKSVIVISPSLSVPIKYTCLKPVVLFVYFLHSRCPTVWLEMYGLYVSIVSWWIQYTCIQRVEVQIWWLRCTEKTAMSWGYCTLASYVVWLEETPSCKKIKHRRMNCFVLHYARCSKMKELVIDKGYIDEHAAFTLPILSEQTRPVHVSWGIF